MRVTMHLRRVVLLGASQILWGLVDFLGKVMFSSSLLQSNFITMEQRRVLAMKLVEESRREQVRARVSHPYLHTHTQTHTHAQTYRIGLKVLTCLRAAKCLRCSLSGVCLQTWCVTPCAFWYPCVCFRRSFKSSPL